MAPTDRRQHPSAAGSIACSGGEGSGRARRAERVRRPFRPCPTHSDRHHDAFLNNVETRTHYVGGTAYNTQYTREYNAQEARE
jgi:hypothetical protein